MRTPAIVDAIADAAQRWCDADFPDRVRVTRAVEQRTGYTEPVVDFALDALFGSIDRESLKATIVAELGSLDALERFVRRPGRPDVTYRARDPVAIVASDTTIGVAVPTLVFALCAGARVRVKDRGDGLVAAFARTIGEEHPRLGSRIEAGQWSGAQDPKTVRMLADARTVVAYGRSATLAALRDRCAPEAMFFGFGHRTSVAYVARETLATVPLARAAAAALARDVVLYDGEGCLSPHAIFVERDGAIAAEAFAAMLGDACDVAAIEFPAGYAALDTAVAGYRDAARFRAAQGSGAVYGGTIGTHLIVRDPPRDEAPPLLRRTAAVYAIAGPDEALAFCARHGLALEAVALSHERPDLDVLGITLAARIAPLGEMQRPPLGGDHGGAGRILPFVRAIYRA